MIIVTGAVGFIGSNLISKLNSEGIEDILAVDDFSDEKKKLNLVNKRLHEKLHRDMLFEWIDKNSDKASYVFHIGARTDTAEFDTTVFDRLNLNYSKRIWELCTIFQIPLIYASSAATYGRGELGYDDSHEIIQHLKPLNPYGESKNDFDKWVLEQPMKPPFWYGFKFFNVYGPNEYHKERMASVIFHAFHQIQRTGKMKLFRSHRPDFADGKQRRDFIYVKDVTEVLLHFMNSKLSPGMYNLGTGKARTFIDLVNSTFHAMNREPLVEFIDIPADIRDKYQYFTEANMQKLRGTGYRKSFTGLEDGVEDYVKNYLIPGKYN